VTLLTGLDGAGKSTFFGRIAELIGGRTGLLRLPHIDSSSVNDPQLRAAAAFITAESLRADGEGDVILKSFALFASMLTFGKLLDEALLNSEQVICERHPLIDTQVYARFYAALLSPERVGAWDTEGYYARNRELVDYLCSLSGHFREAAGDRVRVLLDFIYDWFHIGQKYSARGLRGIFGVELPDRIFYLRADAAVLMQRLGERAGREAHEQHAVLEKLDRTYQALFRDEDLACTVIDTGMMEENLIDDYCKQIIGEEE